METRKSFIGLGSNLGDRFGNIAAAIQALRRLGSVGAVSSLYETAPVEVDGPAFFNLALVFEHAHDPAALRSLMLGLERDLGRAQRRGREARPIDIDLLEPAAVLKQPYYLAALAELAPDLRLRGDGRTLADYAAHIDTGTVTRRERNLRFRADRQSGAPDIALSIDQVGVARVRRSLTLDIDGRSQTVLGEFTLTADLARSQAGVHMSRFSEHLEAATLDVLARPQNSGQLSHTLQLIAREIMSAQGARFAEVSFRGPFTLERWTPVSGRRGEETYHIEAHARASAHTVRTLIGVEVEGMTACPCAQLMMHEQGVRELQRAGFSDADAERALAALPAATHNQRGRGTVLLGTAADSATDVALTDLVAIVEQSLSSETYELLKRPDEFFVVNKAHQNPKFVEDVVRGILIRTLDRYEHLPATTFVEARQINDESIHKHDAVARAGGTFGELRAELQGRGVPRTSMAAWLSATV